MAIVHSFRKHQLESQMVRVVILGVGPEAARNGRLEVGDFVYRAADKVRCQQIALFHSGGHPDEPGGTNYVTELAAYLERKVTGLGTIKHPDGRIYDLPVAALGWRIQGAYQRSVQGFADAVAATAADRQASFLIVITDLAGFTAVTGLRPVYLGYCEVDLCDLRGRRPRISRLTSQLDVNVVTIPGLIPT